jgi:carboxyl-terminal processing protease
MQAKFHRVGLLILAIALVSCKDQPHVTTGMAWQKDPLIDNILELIRKEYVEEPKEEKMRDGALDGMLKALDPYSGYFPEDAYKLFTESTHGEFGGIGLEVLYMDGGLRVVAPLDDTPGAKAGIQPGDFITHVDGKLMSDMSYVEIFKQLHGKPGTQVILTLRRGEQDPFEIKITRDVITINPVKFERYKNIGFIRISYFNEKADQRVKEAVQELMTPSSPALEGFIVDLRNNPGGTLDQAVAVTSLFLDKGKVVEVKSRDPSKNQIYIAHGPDILKGLPMIVLINGGSASASEIFAGALKDHKRAIILGKTSIGKGSVQALFPLKNRGGIKLTISRFYTPSGQEIHGKGIVPDIVAEAGPPLSQAQILQQSKKLIREDDAPLQRAFEILQGMNLLKGTS